MHVVYQQVVVLAIVAATRLCVTVHGGEEAPVQDEAATFCSQVESHEQPQECAGDTDGFAKVWAKTEYTLSDFVVAGRNLALYNGTETVKQDDMSFDPFQLYEDFSLEALIKGDEGWWDLIAYQQHLQRPSLSFYADKVARKRWLPTMGYEQPYVFAAEYGVELAESNNEDDQAAAILKLIPNETDYVAKPSHMSLSDGVWFIAHSEDGEATRFSRVAEKLNEKGSDIASMVSGSLAQNLHRIAHFSAPWPTRNAKAGIVVEERFTAYNDENAPPLEFKMYTIWGRLWIAQFLAVENEVLHIHGYVYRNGTMVKGSGYSVLPEWIDWQHMVEIAEKQGIGKDHFRTDIFVGVPAGTVKAGASEEERIAAVKYVLNEVAIAPTTSLFDSVYKFDDPSRSTENNLSQEGARLWIAGYKMGNYRVVPNAEIPREYLDTGGYYSPEKDLGPQNYEIDQQLKPLLTSSGLWLATNRGYADTWDDVSNMLHRWVQADKTQRYEPFRGATQKTLFSYIDSGPNMDRRLELDGDSSFERVIQVVDHKITTKFCDKLDFQLAAKEVGAEGDLVPRTFSIKEEALQQFSPDEVDIVFIKDRNGTLGKGISIVSLQELRTTEVPPESIFQEGLTKHLALLNGVKVTLRAYFVIMHGRLYCHHMSFIDFQDHPFDPKNTSRHIHLSHTGGTGHLDLRWPRRTPQHVDGSEIIWHVCEHFQVESIVNGTKWMESLVEAGRKAGPVLEPIVRATRNDPLRFSFMGVDLIPLEDGTFKLLEVNTWPSFRRSEVMVDIVLRALHMEKYDPDLETRLVEAWKLPDDDDSVYDSSKQEL